MYHKVSQDYLVINIFFSYINKFVVQNRLARQQARCLRARHQWCRRCTQDGALRQQIWHPLTKDYRLFLRRTQIKYKINLKELHNALLFSISIIYTYIQEIEGITHRDPERKKG